MTALAQRFLGERQQEFLLLIVVGGVAGQARQLLMAGILSHEIQMTLSATRPHNLDASVPKTKNLARIAIAVYVRRSRSVAGFASLLLWLLAFEQGLVRGVGDGSVDVIVARLAGVGANVG